MAIEQTAIACSNPDCQKLTLHIRVGKDVGTRDTYRVGNDVLLFSEQVVPRGAAKPQPDYIPKPLRHDYVEACLIRDLSPKASATLTRRCLQGMIRDFAKVSGKTLFDEISTLKKAVDEGTADRAISAESVEAIDHVRRVGNIGAHMEKDIDLIVPVDPGEAQALIQLVEMLFDEWYGERNRRQQRLSRIAAISLEKDTARKGVSMASPRSESAAFNSEPSEQPSENEPTELEKRLSKPFSASQDERT